MTTLLSRLPTSRRRWRRRGDGDRADDVEVRGGNVEVRGDDRGDGGDDGFRNPITASGGLLIAIGLVCWVAGWRLGWTEAMVVAGGCLVAVVLAVPFVVGRLRLHVARTLQPRRVMQGEPAVAELRIHNSRRGRMPARTIEDRIGDRRLEIEVPGLASDGSTDAVYRLPTDRRGRHAVGPALIVKADPLGLLRREVVQVPRQDFWVQPLHRVVAALSVGWAKDLEGPTSDTSPAGDVAFHNLREYHVGDDYRHIHWLSTARTGTVMVRHYVDNRKPHLAVLLDARATAFADPQEFEVGVQVCASLAVSSTLHQQPATITTNGTLLWDDQRHGGSAEGLDGLTEVQLVDDGLDLRAAVAHARRTTPRASVVVLVTGSREPADQLVAASRLARELGRVIIVRIGAEEPIAIRRARVIDALDLDEFVAGWKQVVR